MSKIVFELEDKKVQELRLLYAVERELEEISFGDWVYKKILGK